MGEIHPYMGYMGMCSPEGSVFLAIFVRNRCRVLSLSFWFQIGYGFSF